MPTRSLTTKQRYAQVVAWFEREMPEVESELHFDNNFQLLVAVMLSAQCTDKRVNQVTPALFDAYPTPQQMAEASEDDLLSYIHSVSYPNAKAAHLLATARQLSAHFHGQVPSSLEELTSLPGVGRKTANVVMAVAFGKPTMAVDTHIFRVSHRLGLVPDSCTTPLAVEKELTRHLPQHLIPKAHHWLLLHGRYVCRALKPRCEACGLSPFCLRQSLQPFGSAALKAAKKSPH